MALTSFVSATHGFHFKNGGNNYIKIGPLPTWKGPLCGGMVYLAYDYFHNKVKIPSDTTQPALGSALNGQLLGRQTTAHFNTGAKFVTAWTTRKSETQQAAEMTALVSAISSSGKPQVICLYGDLSVGHHVLVTDVKMPGNLIEQSSLWEITTYDPNFPDKETKFTYKSRFWEKDGPGYNTGFFKGFFRDTGFTPVTVAASATLNTPTSSTGTTTSGPTTQSGWSWCSKCQGLFFSATGSRCPAGGTHGGVGSGNYILAKDGGMGQPNWRYCAKCHGLHFKGTAATAGLCPAGGPHDPSQSGDYRLEQSSGNGQGGWRYCKRCAALFFSGGSAMGSVGKCPGSSLGHDGTSSGDYWLMMG